MSPPDGGPVRLRHGTAKESAYEPFVADVLAGLREQPKRIAPIYFYDARGSQLFDQICELKEYYPTRTETQILVDDGDDIAHHIGEDATIVFHPKDDGKTEIQVHMEFDPEDFKEQVGGALGFVDRRVDADLKRFKEFIENRGQETGAWRGTIRE